MQSDEFRFIDAFAGIGGFHLGMKAIGGRCVYANERDRFAASTYREWFGDEHLEVGDFSEVDPRTLPDHEVFCAGFPCQPFSLAGVSKKNSLGRRHGFEDPTQGNLFFLIRDALRVKRPPIVFLENVKNLLSHDKGRTWSTIHHELADELGYVVHHRVVDASAWVPQHRERVFIVAIDPDRFPKGVPQGFRFPEKSKKKQPLLAEVLDREPDRNLMISDRLWEYLQAYAEKHRKLGNGFGYGLVGPGQVTRTLSARYYKDGSEILIRQTGWKNPRRLSFDEAARLMGFSSRYAQMLGLGRRFPQVVSLSQSYRQLGNSVCPPVVEAIGGGIATVLGRLSSRRRPSVASRSTGQR